MSVRVAVFASGGGTNLQALLDHFRRGAHGATVVLVVSDRPDAGALERARGAGVPTRVIAVAGRDDEAVSTETLEVLRAAEVELVALAGYVRLVPGALVRHYAGRMVNVHPALLPAFGGKGMYGSRVHRAVLNAGCRVSGPTVHLVDERYDEGLILAQWPVPVMPGDTPETLAARVLRAEHALYPATVEWLGRVLEGQKGDAEAAVAAALRSGRHAEPEFRLARAGEKGRVGGDEGGGVRRLLGLD